MSSKSVVIITKFDDPYQFWFRRREDEDKRLLCEKSWTQTMRNAHWNPKFKGEVGMKVLIFHDGNFKRAIITHIVDDKFYTCWLIDDGVSFSTDRIYQMSSDMAIKPSFAIHGGIINIVATEMRYDFHTFKPNTIFTKHWTRGSIKVCHDLITESNSIVFIRETIENNVEYGQLLLSDKFGIPTSLTMELVEKKFALIDSEKFQKAIVPSEIDDNAETAFEDGLSMMTSPVWEEPQFYRRKSNKNNKVIQPSGLNEVDIKSWLSKTEVVNVYASTTIDSDDSSKPSEGGRVKNDVHSFERSVQNESLQRIVKQNQIYKCSLNVTDDLNLNTTSGAIPKVPQQYISPKTTQIVKSDNAVANDKPDCDWSEIDSSIIMAKGNSPTKTKPVFDTSNFVPAGYNLGNTLSNKSTNSSKSRRSVDACQHDSRHNDNKQPQQQRRSEGNTYNNRNHNFKGKNSNFGSGITVPVKSNEQQRRSADFYHFDKRPTSYQNDWKQRRSLDPQKSNWSEGNYSNDSSSSGRRVNLRRSADAGYQLNQQKHLVNDKLYGNSSSGQDSDKKINKVHSLKSDSSYFDKLINVKRSANDYLPQKQILQRTIKSHDGFDKDSNSESDSAKKLVAKDILQGNSSLSQSNQTKKLLINKDPDYDSWDDDDNNVKVEISEERQLLEKRPSSISSATSSITQNVIYNQTPRYSSDSTKMSKDANVPSTKNNQQLENNCSTSKANNNSIVSTNSNKLKLHDGQTNVSAACKAEVERYMNRHVCKCPKCEPWNDCDPLGPEMGLQFIDDPDNKNLMRNEAKGYKELQAKLEVSKKIEVKPEQLFWPSDQEDGNDRQNIMIKTIASTQAPFGVEGTRMKRIQVPPVLVHCTMLPTPSPTLASVSGFIPSVIDALRRHGYRDSKPMQIYGWPAATNGEHVLLVGGPSTGKTLCHIPTVASAILGDVVRATGREKWGREREPTVIILCTGSKKCDEVYDLYCKLVGKCDVNRRLHIALAIPPLDKQYQDQFKNKIDILITTPIILCKLVATQVMNVKSLNILILEDLNTLLTRFQKEMAAIERLITSMLDHRTFGESIQLFMTSEHWTGCINKFLSRLIRIPFICISDPMETAFYGKAKAQVHMIDNVSKVFHLKELLKDNYHLYKTVVVCKTVKELAEIEDTFKLHAISFTTATMEMEGREISSAEVEWDSTVPGDHKILLCDDSSLMNHFSIRNAATLVHFSLPPDSWKMFTQRFRCMFDSYSSPLVTNNNKAKCQIHIYVDDKCPKQLSRLINCFKQMGAAIPEVYTEMAERARTQNELLKLTTTTPICTHLKLTGACLTPPTPCHHRHMFDYRADRSKQMFGHLPKVGPVWFRLLHVVEATTYYVRLLHESSVDLKKSGGGGKSKRRDGSGDGEERGEVDKEYGELLVEMQTSLRIEGNRVRPQGGAKVGSCYILEEKDKSLRRCRVTKIIESDRITSEPSVVEVFLLDDGILSPKVVAERLFIMPKNIKRIPYLAVEVRLANIVPPGRDNAFSLKIKADVQHLLTKHTSNTPTATATSTPHYYTGVVQLQLGNCLWLDDVKLMRYLRKTDIHLTSLILKNDMIGNFWGEWDDTPMKRLRQLCVDRKLSVPEIVENKIKKKLDAIEQVTPQWAFLETDSWNRVYFSAGEKLDCMYISLAKFKRQLCDLNAFITQQINRPFYPSVGEVTIGRYYLAPDTDQEDTDMCRVFVINLLDEKDKDGIETKVAKCFLVDYGNTEFYNIDKLKYLRDDMITQLPFQAIECSLYGFKYPNSNEINTQLMNTIYNEYNMDQGTDFFRPWYVRVVKKHTVYNPCCFYQNAAENDGEKEKCNRNTPSRITYNIHCYLENQEDIFSLNSSILEETDITDLHCTAADDLLASEELVEELINMIVMERKLADSDEEEVAEENNKIKGGEVTEVDFGAGGDHLNGDVLPKLKYSPQEAFDKIFQNNNNNYASFDDFMEDDDIQIVDKAQFIKDFRANSQSKQSTPAKLPSILNANTDGINNNVEQGTRASTSLGYTPMVALPMQDRDAPLTPEVLWHQTSTEIVMELKILDAENKYKVMLLRGNKLTCTANIDNKKYSLNLCFYKHVKSCEHKAFGLNIIIKLRKCIEEDWPRLIFSKEKRPHIKYNIFKIVPEYDEDDEDIPRKDRKKFLDLGPEFADIAEPEEYWYNEDSDYNNSESDYAVNEFED